MKYLIVLLLLGVFAPAQAAQLLPVEQRPNIPADEAWELAGQGRLTIIDIRTPQEWRQTGVAEGVVRINMLHPNGPSGFAAEVLRQVDGDRDAPIGLICRTGNRTTQVQRYLLSQGFTQVYNIREGMAGSAAGPGELLDVAVTAADGVDLLAV